jgi:flagellar hook-length control protein FliK
MFMPTNSTPVAGTTGTASVQAVSSTAASSPKTTADFLAMLEQLLQGSAVDAVELPLEPVDIEVGDTDTDSDDVTEPAVLADPMLALAALGAPISPPLQVMSVATPAVATAGTGGSIAASAGGHDAPLADLGDLIAPDENAESADDVAALAARLDGQPTGTVVAASSQQAAAPGTQVTTLVTLPKVDDFPSVDVPPDPMAQRVVHSSVGSAAWANELGTRLTFMAGQGQHSASLRLSPEHLGPLEVRIDMNDDKASVWFGAQHADTRAALNEALPRLRELFAASGMMLADSGVSQQAPRQDSRDNAARLAQARGLAGDSRSAAVSSVTSVTNRGILDLYA